MAEPAFSLCVYCGSRPGALDSYADAARAVGAWIGSHGGQLVYGGGSGGLMGLVAQATAAAGGRVVGVIPQSLVDREFANHACDELHIVQTMHERKALMAELSDAFIALPGGFGTFDELFEIITWGQLGIHQKPIGLLNIDGYFDPLLAMIDRAVTDGFVQPQYRGLFVISDSISELLTQIHDYQPLKSIVQWIEMSET